MLIHLFKDKGLQVELLIVFSTHKFRLKTAANCRVQLANYQPFEGFEMAFVFPVGDNIRGGNARGRQDKLAMALRRQ